MEVGDIATTDRAEPRRRAWLPVVVAVVAVVAVLAPMFRSPAPDSFPLSTYPMFAADRGDKTWLDTVVGIDRGGEVVRLSSPIISGSGEPVLASATVTRAIGSDTVDDLCEQVVARLGDGQSGIVEVQVVSERHDLDRFAPDEPLERRVWTRCQATP